MQDSMRSKIKAPATYEYLFCGAGNSLHAGFQTTEPTICGGTQPKVMTVEMQQEQQESNPLTRLLSGLRENVEEAFRLEFENKTLAVTRGKASSCQRGTLRRQGSRN
mmetsp:Transcript_18772/g.40473  ORF Transcript_18772/g.40473 Transcript_18772/m.40473 type:complete len:107 (-) Transcript_18772:927-1247(-)